MDREIFVKLVVPTLKQTIRNKGFNPVILLGRPDGITILKGRGANSEQDFHKVVTEVLKYYNIPFTDKYDNVYDCCLFKIYCKEVELKEIHND